MLRVTLGVSVVMLAACAAEPLSGTGNPGPLQAADAGAPGIDAGAPGVDAGTRDARATGPDAEAAAADAEGGTADSATRRCLEPALDPALARFQIGMVGTWSGTATAPASWNWTKATVEFAFDCDGHYHARCVAHDGTDPECVALYYGTDADSPEKTYAVSDVRADGKATGDIEVYFFPGDTTDDALNAIDLDATGETLSFDLIHLGEYGPIHYALARQ